MELQRKGISIMEKGNENNSQLQFDRLPFDLGIQSSPSLQDFPNFLPFTMDFNESLGLIVQSPNEEVDFWLDKAYTFGSSLTIPMNEGSFGLERANGIIIMLKRILGTENFKGKSFLEIGCGNGFLLNKIKSEGASDCLGIEPSPVALEGMDEYGIKIIRDFFDSTKIDKKFDVVFTNNVIEHIKDPSWFIQEMKKCLKNNGIIINAVPDCENSLSIGDLFLLVHEHYNYFTTESLQNIYKRAGIKSIQYFNMKQGANDGKLYMWGVLEDAIDGTLDIISKENYVKEKKLFKEYIQYSSNVIMEVQKIINTSQRQGKKIGIYGAKANFMLFQEAKNLRVFDGDFAKHGKYIAGCNSVIENPGNLIENPTDLIFILPILYDMEIRSFLEGEVGIPNEKIISFKEICETEKEKNMNVYQGGMYA
jgi:SAM-dependent methyltransferase